MMQLTKYIAVAAVIVTANVGAMWAGGDEDEREGGLTGTGIVGEITALGSIIVNGHRITFADTLPVANVLGSKTAGDLVPGSVVAVAVSEADNAWTADSISEVYPLIGPVTQNDADGFAVMGVPVTYSGPAQDIQPGDWLAVSGFWTLEDVVATRITTIEPRETVSLQGSYSLRGEAQGSTLGHVALGIEPLQHAKEGDIIRVTATYDQGVLAVRDVTLGLFDRPVSLVLAEGYFSSVAPSGHYTVSGSGLTSYTDNLQAEMPRDRITMCGLNGTLVKDRARTASAPFYPLDCNRLTGTP